MKRNILLATMSNEPGEMKMKITTRIMSVMGLGAMAISAGCATVERTNVQAQAGAPLAAQVQQVQMQYDPNQPKYVVIVDPLDFGASGIISGGGAASASNVTPGVIDPVFQGGLQGGHLEGNRANSGNLAPAAGIGLGAQIVTALSQWPNISIADPASVTRRSDGTYTTRLSPGEIGPFIVRGVITEFNETADLSEKKRGASLGLAGAAAGVAGAVTGIDALMWTGVGVAVANPTYTSEKVSRSGMVGMDVQILDGRTARLLRSFNANGTFTTQSAHSGLSLFGIGGGNAEFAASALGQATRAATNDVLMKTAGALASAPR